MRLGPGGKAPKIPVLVQPRPTTLSRPAGVLSRRPGPFPRRGSNPWAGESCCLWEYCCRHRRWRPLRGQDDDKPPPPVEPAPVVAPAPLPPPPAAFPDEFPLPADAAGADGGAKAATPKSEQVPASQPKAGAKPKRNAPIGQAASPADREGGVKVPRPTLDENLMKRRLPRSFRTNRRHRHRHLPDRPVPRSPSTPTRRGRWQTACQSENSPSP